MREAVATRAAVVREAVATRAAVIAWATAVVALITVSRIAARAVLLAAEAGPFAARLLRQIAGALGARGPLYEIDMVDLRVAAEVIRDGALRDVLDFDAVLLELLGVGGEPAQVAGEQADAIRGEQTRDADEELGVVSLHIEGVAAHALGVREGWGVAEDEVPAVARAALLADPTDDVVLDVLVLVPGEAVSLHVALGPVEVGAREVHRRRVLRPAVRGVAGGGAGVGEQVEEALRALCALGELAYLGTHVAVVEEKARVEALGEVDLEDESALVYEVGAGGKREARAAAGVGVAACPLLARVLGAALGALAHT